MFCSTTVTRTALAALALSGCASPEHTNVLIFGTSTRVAIDVSQEPTGALGATLGYKRHEAVFMPLLANQGAKGNRSPATCTTDACRKFQGQAGPDGGASGKEATDTYSVLATFSGDMSGSAQGAQAKAAVAQYFATGLAARLLAQYGGAAAVGSAASAPTSEVISAAANATVKEQLSRATIVAVKLSNADGAVNKTELEALLTKEPANKIGSEEQAELKSLARRDELQRYLGVAGKKTVDRLFEALSAS